MGLFCRRDFLVTRLWLSCLPGYRVKACILIRPVLIGRCHHACGHCAGYFGMVGIAVRPLLEATNRRPNYESFVVIIISNEHLGVPMVIMLDEIHDLYGRSLCHDFQR